MSAGAGSPEPSGGDDAAWSQLVIDLASSVGSVLLVVGLLFAVSGVWPPLVAIESASMDPTIKPGDLVFVMAEDRFPGDGAHGESGVVPARAGAGSGYTSFDGPGDVIVYEPDGNERATPVIHRAMFWVAEGENWHDVANADYVGSADDCEELEHCPAPHAGFVTKGDNLVTNQQYDQVQGISAPVKPAWVVGTAEARIPWLGCLRLRASATGPRPARCGLGLA